MKADEIIQLVMDVTGVDARQPGRKTPAVTAKLITCLLLAEHGYSRHEITDALKARRSAWYYYWPTAQGRLGVDKNFKALYWILQQKITDYED